MGAFDTLSYPQFELQPNETEFPMSQDLIVDIVLKGSAGALLSERWTFSLELANIQATLRK